jgi:hypothetical protein
LVSGPPNFEFSTSILICMPHAESPPSKYPIRTFARHLSANVNDTDRDAAIEPLRLELFVDRSSTAYVLCGYYNLTVRGRRAWK